MGNGWGLEVVRGREVGRVIPLVPGRHVLGNALGGAPGIDLASEEGASPRRMAARQALLDHADGLTLRDLDSPGGTFVNRQRLLADQARPLQPGDLIQLGSVQLRVVNGTPSSHAAPLASAPKTSSGSPRFAGSAAAAFVGMPAPFVLQNGAACRRWDDFLTVSAQHWSALRAELESGRLDAYLSSIGRDDLRPPAAPGSADERLDAWIGRLPTTRPAEPDMEVTPAVVRVRAGAGGGTTRTKLTVTNTGYRLLRSRVRIEPPGTGWVRCTGQVASGPFTTAEATEIPLEVEIPERLEAPLRCFVVVDGNGGVRRIEVRVEPAVRDDVPDAAPAPAATFAAPSEALARLSRPTRLMIGVVGACGARLVLAAGDGLARAVGLAGSAHPSLTGSALLAAAAGGVIGAVRARRRGEGSTFPVAFAAAYAGVLAAALTVALARAVEPPFGRWVAEWVPGACALWAALGAGLALLSERAIPHRRAEGKGNTP